MRDGGELVDVQEFSRVIRIRNVLRYSPKGRIVIDTTRPYL
jgi:hypothetical protein